MAQLTYTSKAAADLRRLESFISAKSPSAAKRAAARMLRGVSLLADEPEIGVSIGEGYRQLILPHGRSGYVVRYRIEDDAVIVTRIWHGKEDRSGAS